MKQKIHRAFGYLIAQNNWERGESYSDAYVSNNCFTIEREIDTSLTASDYREKDFNHIWLLTEGKVECTEVHTGVARVRTAGFCTLDIENQKGLLSVRYLEPSEVFCLSANMNLKKDPIIPVVKSFSLDPGNTHKADKETRLFLAAGEVISGEISAKGPCQVKIQPGKEITATSQCYGLVFM